MGSFYVYFGFVYILFTIDFMSKWIEAKATRIDDFKIVVHFVISHIFSASFGSRGLLSIIKGSHFCNWSI